MGTVFKWIGTAVKSLRDFAYAGQERPLRVGLALGGGFARGIAHVGVLRALQENDIPIDFIAGTSVGALIAAAYASGSTMDEMERQGAATRFRDFGRWTISRMGMASNERLEDFLRKFTLLRHFDDLKIPLGIVATDIISGESVHFRKGEIGTALRASCAYPGLFLPVEYRDHVLVDGFLTEAVPAVCVREMGAELVISVHLEPGLLADKPRNTIEVISRSFSIIQSKTHQPWRDATDILIEPDVHSILWDEFVRTPELVAAGADATRAVVPRIKAALAGREYSDYDGRPGSRDGDESPSGIRDGAHDRERSRPRTSAPEEVSR
jgi:NTE family protein